MLDHLEVPTAHLDRSLRFFADVLAPLGYKLEVDGPAKGFSDGARLDFFLIESDAPANVHFAFEAQSRSAVDDIYRLAQERGHALDRPPALAPHIHPNYYAGYLRDPDGRLVEFVCHKASA